MAKLLGPPSSPFFTLEDQFLANGTIPVKKYLSTREGSGLNAYFVEIDSQVINGYFCYGVDHPEASSIESLVHHVDSSTGLVPKPLRGDTLKPAWQFHGSENSLSDRDQTCYMCTALGEKSFHGIFSSSLRVLENLDRVFVNPETQEENGYFVEKPTDPNSPPPDDQIECNGEGDTVESDNEPEPKILEDDVYCLSEAGEGAMAWEGTLQLIFPGVKSFRNRLLTPADGSMSPKVVDCYFNFYRPDNLTVIVVGTVDDEEKILETVGLYETEYYNRYEPSPFIQPWTSDLPKVIYAKENATSVARFFSRNPSRELRATLCLGWRGCDSLELETAMGLKVITAHLAVGPFWTKFVASGRVERISWCQLEYVDVCSLITMHGIPSDEICDTICRETDEILDDLGDCQKGLLNLDEIQKMAERVAWHHVRELEADPFLMLASAISKGERYGLGENEQLEKRLNPLPVILKLKLKPLDFWQNLIRTYFIAGGTFATKVLPHSYDKPPAPEPAEKTSVEAAEPQQFTSSSRRASSRPRRRASAVGEETENLQTADTKSSPRTQVKEVKPGHLEQLLKDSVFPFGALPEELDEFKTRLSGYRTFVDGVAESENRYFSIETYKSNETKQHPSFPVNNMPFFTFLEDLETSFVYVTLILDTSPLDSKMRQFIAPITAALGAFICPRPPGLDTDVDILIPTEFNPPCHIVDSQVSLGVSGEMMQHLFMMLIVLPEHYNWAVQLYQNLLYNLEFPVNFLKFVASEAIKGLAANYRMQTAEVPNYDCFDASEINLHSLMELIYTPGDSNARLFVGRRRLDSMNEFLANLERDPEGTRALFREAWKTIVDNNRFVLQLGMKVDKVSQNGTVDLVKPWQEKFEGAGKPWKIEDGILRPESDLMTKPKGTGIAVTVNHIRPPCLTTAIPIQPNSEDFPKLCIASQLFSMAQKWIFACFGEDDTGMPVLRMPCSYSHLLMLNLESPDIFGFLEMMKRVINEEWDWLDTLMIAAKQFVINDPAMMDTGPQGAIMMALLAHLSGIPISQRRELLMVTLKVTKEEVKEVIQKYLVKLFDPKECWYALMTDESDQQVHLERFQELGFNFTKRNLSELCSQI